MRDVLLKRIKPQVEAFAAELVELFAKRFEAELAKLPGVLEVALSAAAFQPEPEVSDGDPDRRDDDPVPHLQGGAGRELRGDGPRGQGAAPTVDRRVPRPAQKADHRRAEGQRAARLVDPVADILNLRTLSTDKDALKRPMPPLAGRDIKPAKVPGKMVCSKCGYIGGNARGCGRSHPTHSQTARRAFGDGAVEPFTAIDPPRHHKVTPAAVAAAKDRIARRDAIKARAGGPVVTPSRRAPVVDDNPTARERWTESEIAVETSQAEMYKPDGALPAPSSSWDLTHDGGESGMASARRLDADPEELNFEAEGQ